MMENMEKRYLEELDKVNEALSGYFTEEKHNGRLLEAMRYSLLAGGKRIRPVLVLEFAKACGDEAMRAMPFACAIEMLHTYSLIHDDLPCMDNDDLRRGKPTNHKVFGEWLATVAGDALQCAAFETILTADYPAEIRAECARILAAAAGERGMCGGQFLDMEFEGKDPTLKDLENVHSMKTAAMIKAAVLIGCVSGKANEKQLAAAEIYADNVGLAFQLVDDLLDMESTDEVLGKPVGSDAKNGKSTFASILGPDRCREKIEQLSESAKKAVRNEFEDPAFLEWLADMLANRNR